MDQIGGNPAIDGFRDSLQQPVTDALLECYRAEQIHGIIPSDPVRAVLILTEETGELAEAALELTRPNGGHNTAHLRAEAVQVASVALRIIEAIDSGRMQ